MRVETKRAILKYVRQHDRRETLVQLAPTPDFKGGKVRFSPVIKQHRLETNLTGEKYAEAYFIIKLVYELGYDAEHLELQKEYEIGRPKLNKPRNDIILNRQDGTPFFFIEVKDPDEFEDEADVAIEYQLFALANQERERGLKYLVYCTVDEEQGALAPRMRIIDFEAYRAYEDWVRQGSFSVDIMPTEYGLARKALFVRKPLSEVRPGERTLNEAGGPATFAAIRKNLHDVLWAGGGMFYNDIFTNLVKLFLAKIYDEVTCPESAAYKFQVETVDGRPQSSDDLFTKVNALYRDAQREFLNIDDGDESRGIDLEKISKDKCSTS